LRNKKISGHWLDKLYMKNKTNIALLFLIATVFLLGSLGMTSDLKYSRMSTETEQINFALKFGAGDFNPHHFVHPPFFAYILFILYGAIFATGKLLGVFHSALDYEILYYTTPQFFLIIARIFILFIAALSIIITYKIGKRLFDKKIAILACGFLVFSQLFISATHYATGEVPLLLMSLAAFYFIVRIFEDGHLKYYISAGLLIGLAIATKYNAGLLIAPFLCAGLISQRPAVSEIKKIFMGLAFIVIGFFIGCPFAFFDYKVFYSEIIKQFGRMRSLTYNFESWKADKPGWLYLWTDTFPFSFSWPGVILVFISLIWGIFYRNRKICLLLIFVVLYLISSARWTAVKPRYYIHIFPFMCIIASYFLFEISHRLSKYKKYVLIIATSIVFACGGIEIFKFENSIFFQPYSISAKDWIEQEIPQGSKIAISDGIPVIPNMESIDRQIEEIYKKGYGRAAYLKGLKKYINLFSKSYDVYLLPLPWMENYDSEDFNFQLLVDKGVRYFVISQEFTEYLLRPDKYQIQAGFFKNIESRCDLIKQFRGERPLIEPEHLIDNEYVLIYKLRV